MRFSITNLQRQQKCFKANRYWHTSKLETRIKSIKKSFNANQELLKMNEAETRTTLINPVRSATRELVSISSVSAIFIEFQQHLYSQDNLA
jgi:hypothetical protein